MPCALQSEADHQSTRREYDKLLGELTSLGHTKLEEDKQTLVGVEELTNQLQNAKERMAVAEFRTKQVRQAVGSPTAVSVWLCLIMLRGQCWGMTVPALPVQGTT